MRKCRIGVIGCGGIAAQHINSYSENEEVLLASFCDIDAEVARKYAEEFGAASYSDFQEMLVREKLDGVSICTPPVSHMKIANFALDRGVNVLCEKPLAENYSQALSMVKSAEKNNRLLMVAFKFRFFEELQFAKKLIAEGDLGKIILARNMFGGFVNMEKSWFSKREISGGGVLIDNGSHAIDIFRFLLGEVKNVSARTSTFVQKMEVEETAKILLEMENGSLVSIDLSWAVPVPSDHYFELYGSKGTILFPPLQCRHQNDPEWTEHKFKDTNPFAKETAHFVKCILGEEKPIVTGLDGLKTQQVVAAAYQSIRESKDINITEETYA